MSEAAEDPGNEEAVGGPEETLISPDAPRLRLPDGGLPERVAVLRALHLGDLLCSVPAFRALRSALPNASITLLGLPGAEGFVERFHHLLDGFLPVPGYPGLPEQEPDARTLLTFLDDVQSRRFDLAVQMHGSGITTNQLVWLLGARRIAGFYLPGQFCPDPERFLPYPAHEPEVRRHLALAAFLGIPPRGEELEFPLHDGDFESLEAIPEARELKPGEYACLHPGARAPARRWPAERFAEVGDKLVAFGLDVVLTGSKDETELTRAVSGTMSCESIDLAGRTDLGSLAALLAGSRLLLANDTGVSHVAQALSIPSVIVFTESNPDRWAPLRSDLHRAVRGPSAEVNPCSHVDAPDRHRCLRDGCTAWARSLEEIDRGGIPVQAVLEEAYDLLNNVVSRP